jgi:hypothetical protein
MWLIIKFPHNFILKNSFYFVLLDFHPNGKILPNLFYSISLIIKYAQMFGGGYKEWMQNMSSIKMDLSHITFWEILVK